MFLFLSAASAYDLAGNAYSSAQVPVELRIGGAPAGWTDADARAEVEAAAAAWSAAAPEDFAFVVSDVEGDEDWVQGLSAEFDATSPNGVVVRFDDPDHVIADGVLGVSYSYSGGTFERYGTPWDLTAPTLIVLSPWLDWVPRATIEAGECTDAWSVQAVVTHLLGYQVGLAGCFSDCEEESAMGMPEPCSITGTTLTDDDIAGVAAIYTEPPLAMNCSVAERFVQCTANVSWRAGVLDWDMGDGTALTGASVDHTYTADGRYTVTACFTPDDGGEVDCVDQRVEAQELGKPFNPDDDTDAGGCGGGAALLLPAVSLLRGRRRVGSTRAGGDVA